MNKTKQMQMLRDLLPPTKPGPDLAYTVGQVEAGQDVVIRDATYFVGAAGNLVRTSPKKSKTAEHRRKVAESKAMDRKYNPTGYLSA